MGNEQVLKVLEARLSGIEQRLAGGNAVYMGDGRVLTKAKFLELIYLLDAADRLIVPRFIMDGVYEAEVTSYLLRNITPASRCVDVGANFGYYTCLMARLAPHGHTSGIEADPTTFELLRDNVAINWLEKAATVHNLAASDHEGEMTLYRRDRRSGNTSIINLGADALAGLGECPATPFTAKSSTLDTLFSQPIHFLKVDIEGAEPLLFRGAKGIIANSPDLRIIMEWSPSQLVAAGFDPAGFTEELEAMALAPAALQPHGDHRPLGWHEVRGMGFGNLLIMHKESLI
jgi:FkbM family methyltransferase